MSFVLIHALAKALYALRMQLSGKKENEGIVSFPPYGKYEFTFVAKMPLDSRLKTLLDELQGTGQIAVKDMHALKPRPRKS